MENTRVKMITEAMAEVYWQADDSKVSLLRGAIVSLYVTSNVSKEELDWVESIREQEEQTAEKDPAAQRTSLIEETAQIADETVLWMRHCAAKATGPFDVIIRQAAEFLHDYWSELLCSHL